MNQRALYFLLGVASLIGTLVLGADDQPPDQPGVFDIPQLQGQYLRLMVRVHEEFRRGDFAAAEKACRAALEFAPREPTAHYNLACALARQGRTDDALAALGQAVEYGFNQADHMERDPDLDSLRKQSRFTALVREARSRAKVDLNAAGPAPQNLKVIPEPVRDGVALVTESNTVWDARLNMFRVAFKVEPNPDTPIVKGQGEAGELLRKWQTAGTAAGNWGDFYDNEDGDHSNMDYGAFPQLARIEFCDAVKSRHLQYGWQHRWLYAGVVIGNSSTANTHGAFWRSQARFALTQPGGATVLAAQYFSNHLYIYPEHRDHDADNHGDVFCANTPYQIISQGSSGSDRPFLNAIAATLAAFQPKVKTELTRTGLLMPVVQMIFRRAQKTVVDPEDYFTGKAQPTVFDSKNLDPVKMVTLAHDITPDALPPVALLKVVEEDPTPTPGRDCFDPAGGEKLFDTPCAIARIIRSTRYWHRMVVSAEPSRDLQRRPLTYRWTVLRGRADEIQIKKLNRAGSVVELRIPWHNRMPIAPGSELESNRVDIGAFVSNGVHWSPPAFVSVYFPPNEKRTYDAAKRPLTIEYLDPGAGGPYADPAVVLPKAWRDEYLYDKRGKLTGWTRYRGDARDEFNPDGLLIVKPGETKKVQYVAKLRPNEWPIVAQQLAE